MHYDLRKCKKCKTENCVRCTVLAGKLGNYCSTCFKKLGNREKRKISQVARKIQFWVKYGYYIFLAFLFFGIFTLSLMILHWYFVIFGVIILFADIIYGGLLYKYLSQSSGPDLNSKNWKNKLDSP